MIERITDMTKTDDTNKIAERLNALIEAGEPIYLQAPYYHGHKEVLTLFQVKRFFVESNKLLARYAMETVPKEALNNDGTIPTLKVAAYEVDPDMVASLKVLY